MKKRIFVFLKAAFLAAFCILCVLLLTAEPEVFSQGIKNALLNIGGVLLPTLFPFMVLAFFIEKSGVAVFLGKIFSPVTRFVFRLPEECSAAILMSFIGGYPVGAKMTDELLSKKYITSSQAARMYLFCVNAGPAFAISAVGANMLGSLKAGVVLFVSSVLSSVLIGVSSAVILTKEIPGKSRLFSAAADKPVYSAFVSASNDAVKGMLSISAYVMIFSSLCRALESVTRSQKLLCFEMSLLEVTNGAFYLSKSFSLPVLAAAISFGGLCVHFQVMSCVVKSRLKIRQFFASRVVSAALSAAICHLILCVFPLEKSVISSLEEKIVLPYSVSLPCCVAFLIMSLSLILDIAPKKKV